MWDLSEGGIKKVENHLLRLLLLIPAPNPVGWWKTKSLFRN